MANKFSQKEKNAFRQGMHLGWNKHKKMVREIKNGTRIPGKGKVKFDKNLNLRPYTKNSKKKKGKPTGIKHGRNNGYKRFSYNKLPKSISMYDAPISSLMVVEPY